MTLIPVVMSGPPSVSAWRSGSSWRRGSRRFAEPGAIEGRASVGAAGPRGTRRRARRHSPRKRRSIQLRAAPGPAKSGSIDEKGTRTSAKSRFIDRKGVPRSAEARPIQSWAALGLPAAGSIRSARAPVSGGSLHLGARHRSMSRSRSRSRSRCSGAEDQTIVNASGPSAFTIATASRSNTPSAPTTSSGPGRASGEASAHRSNAQLTRLHAGGTPGDNS